MRILVVAASFSPQISGIQRHALNLIHCLLCRPEISKVDLVVAPWQIDMVEAGGFISDPRVAVHIAPMRRGSLGRNGWFYLKLPALADRLQPDVIHLTYPVPIDAASLNCQTAVTLHDLYPFEIPGNFRYPHVIFNRLVLRHCLQNVDAIACVSEATMACLQRYTPHSTWHKAVVIHNCVEPLPESAKHAPSGGWTDAPFLLSVAQHRKNKNLPLLIRTFHHLRCSSQIGPSLKLIIVGIEGPETQRIHKLIRNLDLEDSVVLLSGLSDPELHWCYCHCGALLLPSITEGFGLPVAEGLLVGCRIVCSDIPAFREIGGPHCCYVKLCEDNVVELADAIQLALQDSRREPTALPHLSAEFLGNRYIDLYKALTHGEASPNNFNSIACGIAGSLHRPRTAGQER